MGLKARSLGFIAVAAPGTPVPFAASVAAAAIMRIQPRRNQTTVNVGNVYIGGADLSKNTPGSIYAVLSPEQVEGIEIAAPAGKDYFLDASQYFVDADNAGDAVLIGLLA